jgi:alanine dehydrogenase
MVEMIANIPTVLLLDKPTVSSAVDLEELINAVESAFAAHARGLALESKLVHVNADNGEFHIKTGGIRTVGNTYFVCKVGAGFFSNRSLWGLPNIIGLIVLCDGTTGVPLAVMDSSIVTSLRTGAATAVAAKYLARSDSKVALVCGAGVQAEIQLRSLSRVLPLKHARVWARGDSRDFSLRMTSELGIPVESAADLGEAARNSDVIVTCTPARTWFLNRNDVRQGTFVAAVGADSPGKQELDPRLLSSSLVICDIIDQCIHVGELQHAAGAGLSAGESVLGTLGDVIIGKAPARRTSSETIIFDSTGTAVQDAAAAALIYERCRARGIGQTFSFHPQ